MREYKNPVPTVDIIIETDNKLILIERKNPPYGWAIPGGFVDYGESLETAAQREALEETSLEVSLIEQFYTYSAPSRDPRYHTITTVFIARPFKGEPKAEDDAKSLKLFTQHDLPDNIAFDHRMVLQDYYEYKKTGKRPKP
ncbi:MAG: NUDIX hydrolase [Deltaproteobacteria bacterium]|nr:NUDIX hydrolase [Deltaproteobacteria bacterium]MCL5791996.1 NUDIX hydrolase [Deltaproteobacteria bacterium]